MLVGRSSRRLVMIATTMVGLCLGVAGAEAASFRTWIGGASGSWSVATSWAPEGVPDNGDSVQVSGATVTVDGSFAVSNLELLAGANLAVGELRTLAVGGPNLIVENATISLASSAALEIEGLVDYAGSGSLSLLPGAVGLTRSPAGGSLKIPEGSSLTIRADSPVNGSEISVPITSYGIVSLLGYLQIELLADLDQRTAAETEVGPQVTLKLEHVIRGGQLELDGTLDASGTLAALEDVSVTGTLRGLVQTRLRLSRANLVSGVDLELEGSATLAIGKYVALSGTLDCLGPQACTIEAAGESYDTLKADPLTVTGSGAVTLGAGGLPIGSGSSLRVENETTVAGNISGSLVRVANGGSLTLFAAIASSNLSIENGRVELGAGSSLSDCALTGEPFVVLANSRLENVDLDAPRFEVRDGAILTLAGALDGTATFDLMSMGGATGLGASGVVSNRGELTFRLSSGSGNGFGSCCLGVDRLVNEAAGRIRIESLAGGGGAGGVAFDNLGTAVVWGVDGLRLSGRNQGSICAGGGSTVLVQYLLEGSGRLLAESDSRVEIQGRIRDGRLERGICQGGLGKAGAPGAASFVAAGGVLENVTNRGTIVVPDGETLTLDESLRNEGTLRLDGDAAGSELLLAVDDLGARTFVLEGGGTVELGDSPNNVVQAAARTYFFNQDNTIRGGAAFRSENDYTAFDITNRGTLVADGSTALALETAANVVNQGTLEVAAGSALSVENLLYNDGRLVVDAAASLAAYGVTQRAGSGDLQGLLDASVALQGGTLTLAGTIGYPVSTSGGTLRIGHGVGLLEVTSSFSMGSNGILEVDLAGAVTHDRVRTTPTALFSTQLAGTVWVRAVDGFVPTPGQQFTFFEYGSLGGEFTDTFNATPYPLIWELIHGPTFNGTVTLVAHEAPPGPDLELEMIDLHDPIGPGAEQVYSLTVRNDGPFAATAVVLTDELPPQTTFVSAQPAAGSCGHAAGVVSCNVGSLAVGGSVEVTVRATVDPSFTGLMVNGAKAFAVEADPIPVDNLAAEDTLVTEGVFTDGFESGDTTSWAATS